MTTHTVILSIFDLDGYELLKSAQQTGKNYALKLNDKTGNVRFITAKILSAKIAKEGLRVEFLEK